MPRARQARVDPEQVAQVRRFVREINNFGSRLNARFVDDYSLTECRVLFAFEGRHQLTVGELRSALEIDSGYMSRILTRFEREGLIMRERSPVDRRRQHATITAAGSKKLVELDHRADVLITELLEQLSPGDRGDVAGHMTRVLDILDTDAVAQWLAARSEVRGRPDARE